MKPILQAYDTGDQLVRISFEMGTEYAHLVTVVKNSDGILQMSDGRYYKLNGYELNPKVLNKHRLIIIKDGL